MKVYVYCLVAALLGAAVAWGQGRDAPRGRTETEDGVEVLTRGPVHEAFARTVTFDPEPGLVAPQAPPAAIEEAPPEQRPEGANVAWMPGYWAWDDERNDFLWVSGIWRALPPGRQWVPGYWARTGQGAQWTSGYWADAKLTEVEYLPEPPATVEAGPNVAAPSADYRWLPGTWLWQQNRYSWRPGYWAAGQTDWDWVPAHYVWTPRGYVFVDGYYDYSVARRGVLFAPVYFSSGIYRQRGFSYSPVTVVNPAVFTSHLFLRPSYGHYYYGDYYGSNYSSSGFSPWFSFHSSRTGYDPFYAQQHWLHRQDRGWEQKIQSEFQNRRDHEHARPPRTWADQRTRMASAAAPSGQSVVVAASLEELAKSKELPLRLQPLDTTERQRFTQHEQAVRQLREQRQKLEEQAADRSAGKLKSSREFQPAKVKLPPSPIAGPPADRLGQGHAPPKLDEPPQPDLKIAPTARIARGKAKSTAGEPKRATGAPPAEPIPAAQPKGRSPLESKGRLPGAPSDGPQAAPQGKSKAESKNNPHQ